MTPALDTSRDRELWQPDREQQINAATTLLSSPLPYAARLVVRELYEQWAGERLPSARKEIA